GRTDLALSQVTSHGPSFNGPPCDHRGFATGEQPSGNGGDQREPGEDDDEVDDRDPAERTEVVSMPGEQSGVSTGRAEERPKEGERTSRGTGEGPAGGAARPRGGQGSEIIRGLAADQANGHSQH